MTDNLEEIVSAINITIAAEFGETLLTVSIERLEDGIKFVYRYPFTDHTFGEIIRLSDPLLADETLLTARIAFKAGKAVEWRNIRNKVLQLLKDAAQQFTIDKSEL